MSMISSRRFQRPGGFTLVELLVTLTLGAILIGVAVPSFRGFTASNRLVTQANDLVGAITFARSEAITRNVNVTLCRADTDVDTDCDGGAGDWSFWILRNAADEVIRRGSVNSFGGSMEVTSDLTDDSLTFGSDGLARSGGDLVNNLAITICSDSGITDNIRRVELGAGSRMSVSKSTGTC